MLSIDRNRLHIGLLKINGNILVSEKIIGFRLVEIKKIRFGNTALE